jgi:hypothetical protein
MVKQNQDLEIIKEHLIPSYKAKINDKETDIIEETSTTETTTQQTIETPEVPTKVTAPGETNSLPVSKTSREPVSPQLNKPQAPPEPASEEAENASTSYKPPEKKTIKEPSPQQIRKKLPSSQTIKQQQIKEPDNPEPVAPATSEATRNIVYSFSDIMDHPFKQYIGILHTIGGILDKTTGEFQPEETISKGDYLTWLFKTYNAYHKNNIPIATAKSTKVDLYDDVPPNHKAYPYIQGLANAGLIIDFSGEKILHPDDPISREELIAFIEYVTRGEPDNKLSQLTPEFCKLYINSYVSDAKEVQKNYSQMIYRNLNESEFIDHTFHIFRKNIIILLPQKAVTRAQAAASLCFIDGMSPTMLGFKVKDEPKVNKKKFS